MSSRFRPQYRQLSEQEKAILDDIKTKAAELETALFQAPASRELSLALTNLEVAVMWAVKAVTA
jgi:hypothetical protein